MDKAQHIANFYGFVFPLEIDDSKIVECDLCTILRSHTNCTIDAVAITESINKQKFGAAKPFWDLYLTAVIHEMGLEKDTCCGWYFIT